MFKYIYFCAPRAHLVITHEIAVTWKIKHNKSIVKWSSAICTTYYDVDDHEQLPDHSMSYRINCRVTGSFWMSYRIFTGSLFWSYRISGSETTRCISRLHWRKISIAGHWAHIKLKVRYQPDITPISVPLLHNRPSCLPTWLGRRHCWSGNWSYRIVYDPVHTSLWNT